MSTFIPKELPAPLSGLSETSQVDDLEAMIARLDRKWGQLKELLRAKEHTTHPDQPDCRITLTDLFQVEGEDSNLGKLGKQKRIDVTPLEANAIMDRMGKLGEEAMIRERLASLEKQNLGLTVYVIFCTLLFLGMLFSNFLLEERSCLSPEALRQSPPPQIATVTPAPGSPPQSFEESKTQPPGT